MRRREKGGRFWRGGFGGSTDLKLRGDGGEEEGFRTIEGWRGPRGLRGDRRFLRRERKESD